MSAAMNVPYIPSRTTSTPSPLGFGSVLFCTSSTLFCASGVSFLDSHSLLKQKSSFPLLAFFVSMSGYLHHGHLLCAGVLYALLGRLHVLVQSGYFVLPTKYP